MLSADGFGEKQKRGGGGESVCGMRPVTLWFAGIRVLPREARRGGRESMRGWRRVAPGGAGRRLDKVAGKGAGRLGRLRGNVRFFAVGERRKGAGRRWMW